MQLFIFPLIPSFISSQLQHIEKEAGYESFSGDFPMPKKYEDFLELFQIGIENSKVAWKKRSSRFLFSRKPK